MFAYKNRCICIIYEPFYISSSVLSMAMAKKPAIGKKVNAVQINDRYMTKAKHRLIRKYHTFRIDWYSEGTKKTRKREREREKITN